MSANISGFVAPGFEGARASFAENFAREGEYQEVGASFAAFHRGKCVVDLWGGFADRARTRPWTRDTLINVWSSTKGIVAIAVAMCVERDLISYDDKVASVWPEFAQNGKAEITLGQLMSHQAGLPGFVEPTATEDMFDWQACTEKLARQAPAWKPGTATSYHAMTFGWLAGEVVQRADGRAIGRFVQEEIAGPLDASFYIGLPEQLEPFVAEMVGPTRVNDPALLPLPDAARMAVVNPQLNPEAPNARAWRAAEIPAANAQATAMGLAQLYAALVNGGSLGGTRLLSPDVIETVTTQVGPPSRQDMFLGFVDSWGLGMAINRPGMYGPNPGAYGHSGWGGSFGCADPDADVAIGYVCNQMGPELVGDPRTSGLCTSVLESAARQ